MPRPYRYHLYHQSGFDRLPDWASMRVTVPRITGGGTEVKEFYSLKKDMDSLRALGVSRGIVDAAVIDVGTSSESRKLWALKVGVGSGHKVLFTGAHHSREWISVEVPYLVAEYLIQNYTATPTTDKERRIHHLLHNRQIWFVPLVNPDGHVHTTTIRGSRMWRANRREVRYRTAQTLTPPAVPAASARTVRIAPGRYRGVDINRNYETTAATLAWGTETFESGAARTSQDPRDGGANSTWGGPSAASEPETQAIQALMRAQSFRANLTYHSWSQLVLFPDVSTGDTFLQNVGNGMTSLINAHGNPYTYESSGTLYPTSGSQDDFAYEVTGRRPTYTIELRPNDAAPSTSRFSGLPESEIEDTFKENLGAALALINCAGHSSAPAPTATLALSSSFPYFTIQIVPNCWSVFRGWTP